MYVFHPQAYRAQLTDAVHSGVQLLSLYHDSLLSKAIAQMPGARQQPLTPHHRYTRFWSEKSATFPK